jgi:hypothetical protein
VGIFIVKLFGMPARKIAELGKKNVKEEEA